jgi:hypothetical protein
MLVSLRQFAAFCRRGFLGSVRGVVEGLPGFSRFEVREMAC